MENRAIAAGNLNIEIVIVQRLKFYLDVAGLHDFVDLSVLLSADKFTMLVRKFDLKADLVLIDLQRKKGTG